MDTPTTTATSSKGKKQAQKPTTIPNFEFKKKDAYEGDISNLVKQLKTSITDIENIDKNYRQVSGLKLQQNHPLLHLDEDANISSLNQMEILDMFLQKATMKVEERLDKLSSESKSKNAKKAQASLHLDKLIEEKRRDYKMRNSLVTAGPKFLFNSFSGFGSIVEIIPILERLYLNVTSQGILETETKTHLILHDIIQLMNDDNASCAMKITVSNNGGIGRRGSFARRASVQQDHGGHGRRASIIDPNAMQTAANLGAKEVDEKKPTAAQMLSLAPGLNPGGGGRRPSFVEAYTGAFNTDLKIGRDSGASTPSNQSRSPSVGNSNDVLNSESSKPEEEIPVVIPMIPLFVGTEKGFIMVFEVMIELNSHDRTKRKLSIDLKVNRNISTSPITHAIYVKLPFPMIITDASRFAVKGTSSGAVQCYLVSFDTSNYDQVWSWNAASGSFEYGTNIKMRSRGMSYVAPRAPSPTSGQNQAAKPQPIVSKYPEKVVTAMTVESHIYNFYVAFSSGELIKFYCKKTAESSNQSHLAIGAGGAGPGSQASPALSRRMSFKAGPGAPGPQAGAFDASSKFSGNEMVMEKLSTFRAKLAKEERLYGSLDDSTEGKDTNNEVVKQPIVNASQVHDIRKLD